jgi:hypothetical protein
MIIEQIFKVFTSKGKLKCSLSDFKRMELHPMAEIIIERTLQKANGMVCFTSDEVYMTSSEIVELSKDTLSEYSHALGLNEIVIEYNPAFLPFLSCMSSRLVKIFGESYIQDAIARSIFDCVPLFHLAKECLFTHAFARIYDLEITEHDIHFFETHRDSHKEEICAFIKYLHMAIANFESLCKSRVAHEWMKSYIMNAIFTLEKLYPETKMIINYQILF